MDLTPEMLEKLRTIGLKLDRAGRFWHQGAEVTHPRLAQALRRWLDVGDDGRDLVRLDAQRFAYVDLEPGAAHLHGVGARWDGDRLLVSWDDGQESELDYGSLRVGDDGAVYATVRGKLRGKLDSAAYQALSQHVVEDGAGFALVAAGKRYPLASLMT